MAFSKWSVVLSILTWQWPDDGGFICTGPQEASTISKSDIRFLIVTTTYPEVPMANIEIWCALDSYVGLLVACLPSLRPYLNLKQETREQFPTNYDGRSWRVLDRSSLSNCSLTNPPGIYSRESNFRWSKLKATDGGFTYLHHSRCTRSLLKRTTWPYEQTFVQPHIIANQQAQIIQNRRGLGTRACAAAKHVTKAPNMSAWARGCGISRQKLMARFIRRLPSSVRKAIHKALRGTQEKGTIQLIYQSQSSGRNWMY